MLSRLLGLPVNLIRRCGDIGLIHPVRRVCRLPYFDFREVASARRLRNCSTTALLRKRSKKA